MESLGTLSLTFISTMAIFTLIVLVIYRKRLADSERRTRNILFDNTEMVESTKGTTVTNSKQNISDNQRANKEKSWPKRMWENGGGGRTYFCFNLHRSVENLDQMDVEHSKLNTMLRIKFGKEKIGHLGLRKVNSLPEIPVNILLDEEEMMGREKQPCKGQLVNEPELTKE